VIYVFYIDIDLASACIRLLIAPMSAIFRMSRSHCLLLFIACFGRLILWRIRDKRLL